MASKSSLSILKIFLAAFALVGIFPHYIRLLHLQKYSGPRKGKCTGIILKTISFVCYAVSVVFILCLLLYTCFLAYVFSRSWDRDDKMTELLLKGFMGQWSLVASLVAIFFAVRSRNLPKVMRDIEDDLITIQQAAQGKPSVSKTGTAIWYKITAIAAFCSFLVLSCIWVYFILSPVQTKVLAESIILLARSVVAHTNISFPTNPTWTDIEELAAKVAANNSMKDYGDVAYLENMINFGVGVGYVSNGTSTTALLGVQILFMLITIQLHTGLSTLNTCLENVFKEFSKPSDPTFIRNLQNVFSQHLDMTLRIQELDEIFGPTLLWLFISDMYVIVTGIGILKGTADPGGLFAENYSRDKFVSCVLFGTTLLALRMFCAIRVQETADEFGARSAVLLERHSNLCRGTDINAGYLQIVNNRLATIRGTFTLYRLCQLNKQFATTVIGVLLTYITLIWEMDKK